MRHVFSVLLLLFFALTSALAQVSIGLHLNFLPELVLVPGYPVYYAPRLDSNYFFYDGRYWLYQDGNWFTSAWYNGPWELAGPQHAPQRGPSQGRERNQDQERGQGRHR